jgi:hypothetical protein
VRFIGPASEAEVVATFLRAEWQSDRWRPGLEALLSRDGVEPAVVADPNLEDAEGCAYRESLLDRHRGWVRREGLFLGLPVQIEWSRVALTPDEVLAIRYVDWDWWLAVSGGTREPLEAARRARAGLAPHVDVVWHHPVAARLRSADPPPELIAVARPNDVQLVLLEGHVRLTAYALYPEFLPDELETLLGTAERMDRWSNF